MVGVVEVCVEVYLDSIIDDDCWECVDIKVVVFVKMLVLLDMIKVDLCLVEMVLVKNFCLLV